MLHRYSSWDGSQEPFALQAEDVMEEVANDLFRDTSVTRALNRLLQRGMQDRTGRRTPGVRDLLERLKQRRQQQLERYNAASVLDGIKERLQDVVDTERGGIQERLDQARAQAGPAQTGDDPARQSALQALEKMAQRRRESLDALPPDPAGKVRELSQYDFMDPEARRKFDELLRELKQRMMEQQFKDMQQGMQGISPEQMQAVKEMLRDLNQMMRQHAQGKLSQEQFQEFMQKHGGMFGANPPQNMEELLDQLAQRMAQAQSLLNSMPEQTRQEMQDLMESLLDDEAREQMAQLAAALEAMRPTDRMEREYEFSGGEDLPLEQAMRLMEQLQDIDGLEGQLQDIRTPQDMEKVDEAKLEQLLGEEARRTWEQLKDMLRQLEEAGFIRRRGDRMELTPKGIRKIGQKAIRDIFAHLKKDRLGAHQLSTRGFGGEPSGETKPWTFGDEFSVDLQRSLMNTVLRAGRGTPVRMEPGDFEVQRIEHATQAATCLLIDRSRSMGYYGNFSAAKKVAIALHTLIRTTYARDALYIIGFSDIATEFKEADLPELHWDTSTSGTNMHHAFMLSRKLLARHRGSTRQIIMITDGEPTAHLERGHPYFSYPPSPRTIAETLKEARRLTQEGITVNTFMLENSYPLVDFVNMLTRINRGRAFYASPDKLGQYVLVDYMQHRRRNVA
ncbi:MAG: VWA domain-containing protein [Dehalococcoidia bacterium]|nr:VWA domain-containing protein [Dehalococcoidia bacterium]